MSEDDEEQRRAEDREAQEEYDTTEELRALLGRAAVSPTIVRPVRVDEESREG